MMKYFIPFLFITNVSAWEMVKKNDHFYLEDKTLKVSEKVSTDGVHPGVEVKSIAPGLDVIYYTQSVAGTKYPVHTWNCALYSKDQKKFIFTDELCRTKTTEKGKDVTETATIEVRGQSVFFQFEELEESFKLSK